MKKPSPSCRDSDYFKNYAGSGRSYDRVWRHYSYAEELIQLIKRNPETLRPLRKLLVLGAATGKVLEVLDRGLGLPMWGCEINRWARQQIPPAYRRRIRHSDMRDYIDFCLQRERNFDLTFSNSLIYLEPKEILSFLKKLARVTRYLHFNSSREGHACPDPYRQTLKDFDWWNRQLQRAGFAPVRIRGQRRSYLWTAE